MSFRYVAIALMANCVCACSSLRSTMPATMGKPAYAALSAVRAPASVLARRRGSRDDLSSLPFPISALAFPISALAFPISALAFPGTPEPATVDACAASDDENGDGNGGGDGAKSGTGSCKAQINTAVALNPNPLAAPAAIGGVQPGLLRYIYNVPNKGGSGQTVGIVVAHDDPNAESDLAVYRSTFGIPACTTANGCFTKLPQSGNALPVADASWSVETSLDLAAVSAVCSACKIVLVEANSNLIPDLATAEDTAVAAGATVVSNSYGVAEASDNVGYASHYIHPGVPVTAAAGDLGYGVQFPAAIPTVTAVGGTSVQQIGDGAIQEVIWPATGSGCSLFFPKPSWQHDAGCTNRTVNDVAILADPSDGISVYDSTLPNTTAGGWSAIGGTSLGAPLVAAFYALAAKRGAMGSNAGIYASAGSKGGNPPLINVTAGNNGACASAYLCNGGPGYNAPSGNGVPWGVGAFAPVK